MKQELRKAGISFQPEEWSSTQTRIQLRRDSSFVEKNGADEELGALLPQWLEPFVLPSGSRDPLGLQAPAEKLVNEVLPGLTVFTFRAGYYGFLTWAIRSVNGLTRDQLPKGMSRSEALNALERALAICEFVHHGLEDGSCTLIGQRSKLRVLSSNEGDRYRVPESILKNQNTAGSFRLFATSLVSLGLAEESDELAAEGLLPFRLTSLGEGLASVFHNHVDPSFISFALGEQRKNRDTLRNWGMNLCFSSIAHRATYRKRLIQGLLLGDSRDAEKRYRTVVQLFAHRLFEGGNDDEVSTDSRNEEDAAIQDVDTQGAGMSNMDVVLHFYGYAPHTEIRQLQSLSVYELLSLGMSAIFRAAVVSVTKTGKADIVGLTRSISAASGLAALWKVPMKEAKPKTVRKLTADLLACKDAVEAASIGGMLLVRVLRDPLRRAVWNSLSQTVPEPVELVDRCINKQMDRSLAAVLPELLLGMVERHDLVSRRKNRQRWLFVEGNALIRDDPQEMGVGFHSLRFPQFGSIARDVGLQEEDLRGG